MGFKLAGRDAEIIPYGLPKGVGKFNLLDPDQIVNGAQTTTTRRRIERTYRRSQLSVSSRKFFLQEQF